MLQREHRAQTTIEGGNASSSADRNRERRKGGVWARQAKLLTKRFLHDFCFEFIANPET
jgi:hypothetical protein